ncbi:LOW QUALITY PROTEIN: uncharacterized protein LOC100369350 [Saccoglossus kowalevskii]
MRDVWMECNGTLANVADLTVETGGFLYLWSYGSTYNQLDGVYEFGNVTIRADGKFELLTVANYSRMSLGVTLLDVKAGGYVRTNDMKLTAVNVTIDVAGDMHSDWSGYSSSEGPGAGLDIQDNTLGGSGGGHGGRGGHSDAGLYSAYSYDSMYSPSLPGSGGGNGEGSGGRGGGVMHLEVANTLRVEGRLHSNGEANGDSGGGGAGGSIMIQTGHLDGSGTIEVKGGQAVSGGGGSGGRLAIYTDWYDFIGQLQAYGGTTSHNKDMRDTSGSAGTVYTANGNNNKQRNLYIDNTHDVTEAVRVNEIHQLSMAGKNVNWYSTTFTTYGDVVVTTTGSVCCSVNGEYPFYNIKSGAGSDAYYRTTTDDPTITYFLPFALYVDHIKIYPQCSYQDWTNYEVIGELNGEQLNHTNGYVETTGCQSNEYGRVNIGRFTDKIIINLHAISTYAAVNEIEIYIREDPESAEQKEFTNHVSAMIVSENEETNQFEFEEINISGRGSLGMSSEGSSIISHDMSGDYSGLVTIRHQQELYTSLARELVPYSILIHSGANVTLPTHLDCRNVELIIRGEFDEMENLTISKGCAFTLQHLTSTTTFLHHVIVKTDAQFTVLTKGQSITTLEGATFSIRSGGLVYSDDLVLNYENITIEPYAHLSADESVPLSIAESGIGVGHPGQTGSSGGGHGGTGGQGSIQSVVGRGHGSFLTPNSFGRDGGHEIFPHLGGAGGGKLFMSAKNRLVLDGSISANGGEGRSPHSGGGSGGSVRIECGTLDGDGYIEVIGGDGRTGTGGGGGGGRIAVYYTANHFIGDFFAYGGDSGYEPGGAGTVYLHKLLASNDSILLDGTSPEALISHDSNVTSELTNRTLYINNIGRYPRDMLRNLTSIYQDLELGSTLTWITPGEPSHDNEQSHHYTEHIQIDELHIYGGGHVGFVFPERPMDSLDIRLGTVFGDRTGRLHVGYNQSYFSAHSAMPMDMFVYQRGLAVLHGELKVDGVTVNVEGVLENLENISISDGGKLYMHEMINIDGEPTEMLQLQTCNVRNHGIMYTHNGMNRRTLLGHTIRVYGGAELYGVNLHIETEEVIVDSLGSLNVDNAGYRSADGPGGGFTYGNYGTGGSHGGSGSCDSESESSPPGYGSFVFPNEFGSGGGMSHLGANGGMGGGILTMNVSRLLRVEGALHANGENSQNNDAGGGSGGSMHIIAKRFEGMGSIQVNGGSGHGGGSGGRLALYYEEDDYSGVFESAGGAGYNEHGASGTVYLKKQHDDLEEEYRTLRIYNSFEYANKQSRKTWVNIPENVSRDYDIDLLDIGGYAHASIESSDINGWPSQGLRRLSVYDIAGDHTATVHVSADKYFDIVGNATYRIPFSTAVYENGTASFPSHTYLQDVDLMLYGGHVFGIDHLELSLNGQTIMDADSRINSKEDSIVSLKDVTIHDGGVFHYTGDARVDDALMMTLTNGLHVRGGGSLIGNQLHIQAKTITVDDEGEVNVNYRGYGPGEGPGAGIDHVYGGTGASHGGRGGIGSWTFKAAPAYDNVLDPVDYGSGGSIGGGTQATGSGGGTIQLIADVIIVDGVITSDGGTSDQPGNGGASGGSIHIQSDILSGTGEMSSNGGDGACVLHCNKCNEHRECLECTDYKYWRDYNCIDDCDDYHNRRNVSYSYGHLVIHKVGSYCVNEKAAHDELWIIGGGGGGGRIALYTYEDNRYTGNLHTYGGVSYKESGGPGTIYMSNTTPNGTQTTLIVDNQGRTPLRDHRLHDVEEDSARAYIITGEAHQVDSYWFDEVHINQGAHLAFESNVNYSTAVEIGKIYGDLTGMLHSAESFPIIITESQSPFPAAFYIYEDSYVQLPTAVTLSNLDYPDIYIDGEVDGVQNLVIGTHINLHIGSQGHSSGDDKKCLNLLNLDILSDGAIQSWYGQDPDLSETNPDYPSLNLSLSDKLHIHPGGKILTAWVEVNANTVIIDEAGFIDVSEQSSQYIHERHGEIYSPYWGGSGGGHGGSGGQGYNTQKVGPAYGYLHHPRDFGTGGGNSGGNLTDGGRGGGVISITALDIEIYGSLKANGGDAMSVSSGGGGGGGVYTESVNFRGYGLITVNGGSVPEGGNYAGGGGGGGRMALNYINNYFTGHLQAYGGRSLHEVGGAGTIILHNTQGLNTSLYVDNNNIGRPLNEAIDYISLVGRHRGSVSCRTWVVDQPGYEFLFDTMFVTGQAELAFVRPWPETMVKQNILAKKSEGDGSGIVHIGPLQVFDVELPHSSPRLRWGITIYPHGEMITASSLEIYDIAVIIEGTLTGGKNVTVGRGGKLILRHVTNETHESIRDIGFDHLEVYGGGRVISESDEDGLFLTTNRLHLSSGSVFEADRLTITSHVVILDDQAMIDLSSKSLIGGSAGLGEGHYESGAGHGGEGGKGSRPFSGGGMFYGDFVHPNEFGSMASNEQSHGGGVLKINTDNLLHIDGIIRCDGESGKITNGGEGGGASGGSVLLVTNILSGVGRVEANGGAAFVDENGECSSGGGGGGRIAAFYHQSNYHGIMTAYGGISSWQPGAAGTVYYESTDPGVRYNQLVIDNNGQDTGVDHIQSYESFFESSGTTWLTLPTMQFSLTELKLLGMSHLAIEYKNHQSKELTMEAFIGEHLDDYQRFGTIHVGPKQTVRIQKTEYYLPCNVRVYNKGDVHLPTKIKFENNHLYIDGGFGAPHELSITNATVEFGGNAHSSSEIYKRRINFRQLSLLDNGVMDVTESYEEYTVRVDQLTIQPRAVLKAKVLLLEADLLSVAPSGHINADFTGDSVYDGEYTIFGGAGGSHGGDGGIGEHIHRHSISYDSIVHPVEPGKAGGCGSLHCDLGGAPAGGGVLHIISDTLENNGVISARGQNADDSEKGARSGGGAGGSVWIEVENLIGNGKIDVSGGDGHFEVDGLYHSGGGGGGGYVSIGYGEAHVTSLENIATHGGIGYQNGAAGAVYTEELIDSGTTSKVLIDNKHMSADVLNGDPVFSNINFHPDIFRWSFDEVQLLGSSNVKFVDRSDSTEQSICVNIGKISGDWTSLLSVETKQEVYVGDCGCIGGCPFSGKETVLEFNVKVDKNARFGTTETLLLTKRTQLDVCGQLVNTKDITIQHGGELLLGYPASTSGKPGGEMNLQTVQLFKQGTLKQSDSCENPLDKLLHVHVSHFIKYYNSTLDVNGLNITQNVYEDIDIGPTLPMYCLETDHLHLLTGQDCSLKPGAYSYNSITIESGAIMFIEGDSLGIDLTQITVTQMVIHADGLITGNGAGHHGGGDGLATGINGASHGGRGGGNTAVVSLYGGGNGHSGSHGGGGGRISLEVPDTSLEFTGLIDVAGGNGTLYGTSGTLFIKDMPQSVLESTLVLAGSGSEPVLIPFDTWSDIEHLHNLQVLDSVVFDIDNDITVDTLMGDNTGSIIASTGVATIKTVLHPSKGTLCNFDVRSGAEVHFINDIKLSSDITEVLQLNGKLVTPSVTIDEDQTILVADTGVLETEQFILGIKSVAVFSPLSMVGIDSDLSLPGSYAFNRLEVGVDATLTLEAADVSIVSVDVTVKSGGLIQMTSLYKTLHVIANATYIESEGLVSVNEGGHIEGTGRPSDSTNGASHGGEGGYMNEPVGEVYGSTMLPSEFGSGCGSAVNQSRGGGILTFAVNGAFVLEGILSSNGGDGSVGCGGGSGGSVLVEAGKVEGHGQVTAHGGSGAANISAGGSGGRVALYSDDVSLFSGDILAYGGHGTLPGAAGTAYMKYTEYGLLTDYIIINNNNQQTPSNTIILNDQDQFINIANLKILKHGRLEGRNWQTIDVGQLVGDNTGTIIVIDHQNMSIATSFGTSQPYILHSSIIVEENGELRLPSWVYIDALQTKTSSIVLKGILNGAQDLVVGDNAVFEVYQTAHSALSDGDEYLYIDDPGTLTFNSINILSNGKILFNTDADIVVNLIVVSSVNVKYRGLISGKRLNMITAALQVDYEGMIMVDGGGYVADTGPGAGVYNDAGGSGASHGGCGGIGSAGIRNMICSYGTLYESTEHGSGGGSSIGGVGGTGGGILSIEADKCRLDGIISAAGLSGTGSAGGGSGGTLYFILNETQITEYEFNELHIKDNVVLQIEGDGTSVVADEFYGDVTSVVHVHQTMIMEIDKYTQETSLESSFHVDQGGEMRLPPRVTFLGPDNILSGTLTNVFDLSVAAYQTIVFSQLGKTALFRGGEYTYISEPGAYKLTYLTLGEHSTVQFEGVADPTNAKVLSIGTIEAKYGSVLTGRSLKVIANDIILHAGSTVDLNGQGYDADEGPGFGDTVNDIGYGAGHGGFGGIAKDLGETGGTWYDTIQNPIQSGSGGGSGVDSTGGSGGGYLQFTLSGNLILEGTIHLSGNSGSGPNSGGGSGGGALIRCNNLIGHGRLVANGGSGINLGGGGAGGRVTIFIENMYTFAGSVTVYGGSNDSPFSSYGGGVGTFFLGDIVNQRPVYHLFINGNESSELHQQSQTMISDDSYDYDYLSMMGYAKVYTEGVSTVTSIGSFIGDKTATYFVNHQQVLYAERFEGMITHMTTEVNFLVNKEASIVFPDSLSLSKTRLEVLGRLVAWNIVIDAYGELVLHNTSYTAVTDQSGFLDTSLPGSYLFTTVIIKKNAMLDVMVGGLSMTADFFEVKRDVILNAEFFNITARLLYIDRNAALDVSGMAPMNADHLSNGDAATYGGGAYASPGGVGIGRDLSLASQAFGTIYTPNEFGTSGGSGGMGGGIIRLVVTELHNNGFIRADGQFLSGGGGGGSGGSVWLTCSTLLTGHGHISAIGGSGSTTSSGSGSGGRIAINSPHWDDYHGTVSASGGSGHSSGPGGAGSIYIQEVKDNSPFEILKIDNSNKQTDHYFTLKENWIHYDINELYLSDKVKFQLPEDDVERNFNIGRLVGDGSALIHIHNQQSVVLERELTENITSTKTMINIKVDELGEVIMSSSTWLVGNTEEYPALDLAGRFTGVHNLYLADRRSVIMRQTAHTAEIPTPTGEQVVAPIGIFTFATIELYSGSTLEFEPNMGAHLNAGFLGLKFTASISADYFVIKATTLDVEIGGIITCSGNDRNKSETIDLLIGTGDSDDNGGGGAGHGSYGGIGRFASVSGGIPYGSIYTPDMPGSRGGLKSNKGGGTVLINTTDLIIDGMVTTSGGDGVIDGGSGSSGGSIWIDTTIMNGFGDVTVNGGNGALYGGGGSAGRTAVYTQLINEFRGNYHYYGGNGYNQYSRPAGGGSGTLYLEETRNSFPYQQLRINNQDRMISQYVTLSEWGTTEYEFDEVHIHQSASLHINKTVLDATFIIHEVHGDRSGLLHTHGSQLFIVEVIESVQTVAKPAVNFIIDEDAEVIFPSTLHVIGNGVLLEDGKVVSLQLDGTLTNVAHLVVGQESKMYFMPNAHTAVIENGEYLYKDSPGEFQFGSLQLMTESLFTFAPDMGMKCSVGELDIKYGVKVAAEHIIVFASQVNVEDGADVTVSVIDRPDDSIHSEYGTGHEAYGDSGAGGGGHASFGGDGYTNTNQSDIAGGIYFGTIYQPTERGGTGGRGTNGDDGGRGGGFIKMIIGGTLYLDGNIKSDGGDGMSESRGGGGAGGSVWLDSAVIEGHGTVTCHGGLAYGVGAGGGSGGRLAVYTSVNHFKGKYDALGGDGDVSKSSKAYGGPGSVYIQEIRNQVEYSVLKIDNNNRGWTQYYTLDESDTLDYEFDVIEIVREASLQTVNDTMKHSITIHTLNGDFTGLLHMHAKHTYYVDVIDAKTSTLKTQVNMRIDPEATAVLATTVDIRGKGDPALSWNGQMEGVRHLRIAHERKIEIGPYAHTSLMIDGSYVFRDEPGTFRFSSLEFGAESHVSFPPPMGIDFTVGYLDMKWSSSFLAEFFKIYVTDFHLEPGAALICSGRGPVDGGLAQGNGTGAGAGHATYGGDGLNGIKGGGPYGSIYEPQLGGSRGGAGSNGETGPRGGGTMGKLM